MFPIRRMITGAAVMATLTTVAGGSEQRDAERTGQPATTAVTVNAVKSTVTLGGGKAVVGAQGIALDPSTGLVYIGLQGTIIGGGCEGFTPGVINPKGGPGANQMSIVDPSQSREIAAVPTDIGPIWPTVDPDRRVVYMANGSGSVTRHDAATGAKLATITVGGSPHQAGLDYSTRLMLVSNTVQSTPGVQGNQASVIDTSTDKITRAFTAATAPHGVVVDQDHDLIYLSGVVTGEIIVVSAATGQTLFTGDPNSAYGTSFGNNNLLARQASTRRLFQANSQGGYNGALVVDEITLKAEGVIRFNDPADFVGGMWVDEPNRLLFAALAEINAIGVADLDTLMHVATIPVGPCPFAVTIDPVRHVGVTSNQGTPTVNASASIIDLCPVYAAANRIVSGCSSTPSFGPTNLLGLADGTSLSLAWKNIGTAATTMTLNVTGAYTGSLPLSSFAETFQYSGVPAGTYVLTVVAKNTSGDTSSSSPVSLTFPGTCAPPQTPANFLAVNSGRTITVSWEVPASGAAPTSYVVNVTGAYVGPVPVTGRTVAGTVSPGSYTLSVAAVNRCGSSTATATTTIVIS